LKVGIDLTPDKENPMTEPVVKWAPLTHMPLATIYMRLGYREGHSDSDAIRAEYEPLLQYWVAATRIRIFYLFQPFAVDNGVCRLGGNTFTSRLIAERFSRASKVLLMAASADPADFEKIQKFSEEGDLKTSVLLDAVLSEKVDFALDFLETEMKVQFRREGQLLGQRLSCGYGDFKLENQRYLAEALHLGQYGITLDERFILHPEKTVTALAPVYASN
jgi:hypothetical protein